jgi:serine/threonine protein kinase
LPHDRAHRPDHSQGSSQGSDPSAFPPGAGGHSAMGGSMPDIRANNGGTYFLGRYRIVDEIGIGGMASVHLARMDGPGGFQKWVAIKKIHPHLVEDESFVQMFLDEARVAARISHPNVATVFDLGKHEDTYWIAMEYLHGEPLREVMRRTEELGTAMPPEIACRVIADAAEGLHAAHELLGKNGEKLGLVHRDVTPHNLFVTYDGVTKVVDFGIAKFSSRMSHTRAGTLKGKLAYMSPEQVHGSEIDRRTDIFALGVVLWELTTGQRLFRMESDLDTLAKVQECNVPRPSTLIRGYPVDLEKIVMKALAKNRGERFKTARELSRALQSLLMRRGLFIASDEVAAYTQSIFNDRIAKREAHLRWAAEVTSTINVDQLLSKPKLGPEFTGNSDVQAQAKPAGVRPAAGMPAAPITGPMAEPEPRAVSGRGQSQHAYGGGQQQGSVDDDMKSTASSLETQARPLSANMGGSAAARAAAIAVNRNNPSMQQQQQQQQQQQLDEDDHDHPADGDGPTIQASSPMPDALPPLHMSGKLGNARDREPMRSEPPTLMQPGEGMPASQNDGPTMMASPAARAAMIPTLASGEVMAIEPEDDFEEDQDATMVANTRGEGNPLQAPPTFPQVSPAAGRSNAPAPSQRRAGPQPFAQTAALGSQVPQMLNPLGFPQHPSQQSLARSGEMPFGNNETMGMPQGHSGMSHPPGAHDPQDYQQRGMIAQAQDFNPRSGPHPTGESGQFIPRHSQRMAPPNMRMGAPTYDNRTMTAQRYKRRPPMWVVAALSCSIALLIAGVVIAIVSSTGNTPPKGAGVSSPSGSVAGGPNSPPSGAASAAGTGPFSSAKAAFNAVVSQPGSSATPPGAPPGSPPGAVTAPPVMTAAVTPDPTPATPAVASPTPAVAAAAPPPAAPVIAPAQTQPRPAAPPVVVASPPPPAPTVRKPAALGAITVVCMPKCDQIIDNGTPLGPGHIFNRPVPSGRHVLQLSAPNGARKNLVVEVAPEQTKEVRMSMDR